MAGVDDVVEKLRAKLCHIRQTLRIDIFCRIYVGIVRFSEELSDVDGAKITRVIEMQLLLSARITRIDRAHRRQHVVVPIDLVDKDDTGFGVLMRRSDDAIPDVRREDHAGHRRFFDRAIARDRGACQRDLYFLSAGLAGRVP